MNPLKAYTAGPITGIPNFADAFTLAELTLTGKGIKVMNPAILPGGFEHHEYMKICLPMVEVCDVVLMLPGWDNSKGACMEHEHALQHGKKVFYSIESLLEYHATLSLN